MLQEAINAKGQGKGNGKDDQGTGKGGKAGEVTTPKALPRAKAAKAATMSKAKEARTAKARVARTMGVGWPRSPNANRCTARS